MSEETEELRDESTVEYWVREIEQKGSDAVSSVLASKLGTPESKVIQMAMVEYHRKKEINEPQPDPVDDDEQIVDEVTSSNLAEKAFKLACAALAVSGIALILTVYQLIA